ncbi:HAD family hydrolase [Planococcus faecalis]|uniref:Phosphoserine phosphatase n=1 Tax=Planococcus faecalis TaxID=1598147 RepID=A0ABM6IVU5_9BACL|nr:HAD family hydrolase [Planococcus faecalis]AQU80491.1 haloacid dehalogenase [Planococcus faecalis]OHX52138.1 haloacid dehalogenase [Planococcus faecalis]
MVKAIFFDLDDTLLWDKKSVEKAFQETCSFAEELTGQDCSGLETAVRMVATELYARYDTYAFTKMIGINPFEGLWGNFDDQGTDFQQMKTIVPTYRQDAWTLGLQHIGIENCAKIGSQLADFFPKARKRNPVLYEESLKVLADLKEHYQLLLLTNGSPSLQQLKLEITPEIAPFFDHIIVSGAYGKGKPDPSIFQYALSKSNVLADEVLMVGDNLMTDIIGAEKAGIRSVWINREQKAPHETIIPTYEIQHLEELLQLLEQL